MSTETKAAQTVASLAGTHEVGEPPDIYTIFADFGREPLGDTRAWWLGMAQIVCSDPLATDMFLAKAAGVMDRDRDFKEWGYLQAVKFAGARGSEQRQRSGVGTYDLKWAHQAARDGMALGLWGGKHPDLIYNGAYVVNRTGWCEVPGVHARAKQLGCSWSAYDAVRKKVSEAANDLINEAAFWLDMCRNGAFSSEYIRLWEQATQNVWPGSAYNPH